MRELTVAELDVVTGAGDQCSSGGDGNSYGGVTNTSSFGQDLINIYEGLVFMTSHIIERVANTFE